MVDLSAAAEIQAADQRPVWWVKTEPPAAEPACVEPGVEEGPGSTESERPAGRWRSPRRKAWSVAELLAVLVVGHRSSSLVTRPLLLLLSLLLYLRLAAHKDIRQNLLSLIRLNLKT